MEKTYLITAVISHGDHEFYSKYLFTTSSKQPRNAAQKLAYDWYKGGDTSVYIQEAKELPTSDVAVLSQYLESIS